MNIKVLTHDQIDKIRDLTEQLIAETGFSVQHAGLREIARNNGADTDEETGISMR